MTEPPYRPPAPSGPCRHCPYRADTPSGIWAAHEYEKLPAYDGSILQQLEQGAFAVHLCNRDNGRLCAGWVACHGAHNLLSFRMASNRMAPAVAQAAVDYTTDTDVHPSGWAAAEHGMRDIDHPGPEARKLIAALRRRMRRRETTR